jgi:hypothetical protein
MPSVEVPPVVRQNPTSKRIDIHRYITIYRTVCFSPARAALQPCQPFFLAGPGDRWPGTLECGPGPSAMRHRRNGAPPVSRSHPCSRYPSGDRILVSMGAKNSDARTWPRRVGRRARSPSCAIRCWFTGSRRRVGTIGPEVVAEVLRDKARFGAMGRQELPPGAAEQGAAGWVPTSLRSAPAALATIFGRSSSASCVLACCSFLSGSWCKR